MNTLVNTFQITDTITKEIVATRRTIAADKVWAGRLNEGLALFNGSVRYSVSKCVGVVS